ncbi:MAG: hypothetical protein JEY94_05415 [Melioribacteraceae bacterium]|nr:hypothetical protein [Melioribacteraceae bacterium]
MFKKLVGFVLFALAINVLAVNGEGVSLESKTLKLLEENCIESLEQEYVGVLEATIYNTIVFKSKFPDYKFDEILSSLKEVSQKEISPIIKYEAQLAILFIENYSLFENVKISNQFNPELFKEISSTIHNKMLALK